MDFVDGAPLENFNGIARKAAHPDYCCNPGDEGALVCLVPHLRLNECIGKLTHAALLSFKWSTNLV
jgi:hypothetical protein